VCGLAALFGPCAAVAAREAAAPDTVLARAERLFRAGSADSVLLLVAPLAARAAAAGDRRLELNARLHEAGALCVTGRLRESETAGRRAQALADAVDDSARARMAARWVAYSLLGQGRAAESAELYRALQARSLAAGDPLNEGYARIGLAYLALQAGEVTTAIDGYERAVALFARAQETVAELDAMVGLARAFALEERYDDMRRLYRRILERSGAAGLRRIEAFALNNLAVYESQSGDPGRAVTYWERSLQRLREAGDLLTLITPVVNLTVARMELGEFDAAERQLAELAEQCARQGYGAAEAAVRVQIGVAQAGRGHLDTAERTWRQVLTLAAARAEQRAEALQKLAQSLTRRGRPVETLALLDAEAPPLQTRLAPVWRGELALERASALAAAGHCDVALAPAGEALATARRAGFRQLAMRARLRLAGCATALGAPDSALAQLRQAQRIWEELRTVPRDPLWREQRGALGSDIHLDLARLLLRHPVDTPAAARCRAAFDLLQRFKARTLSERMLGPDAFDATRPDLQPPVSLARLQGGILGPNDLLLDFYAGEAGSLVFAVSRDTCAVAMLPPRQELDRLTALTVDLLTAPDGPDDATGRALRARAAGRVAREIVAPLAPLLKNRTQVIVALDGALHRLPIELLLPGHTLFRVPSATVLATLRAGDGPGNDDAKPVSVAALADRRATRERELPGATAEVDWLARHFRRVAVRANLCAPTPGQALAELSAGRRILHVATHTEVFDQRPWNSRLLVGTDDDDEPCALTAADIATLRLDTRLAVLSGCASADGRVLSGEGVLGLTGAFLGAGARAAVVSLWPVDDIATLRLMRRFYDELAAKRTVAEALRRARERLASEPQTAHPFYWAGFVVVGDGAIVMAPERRRPAIIVWLAGVAPVLLAWPLVRSLRARRRRIHSPCV
jgi:tetratricopeptide (TPR) repeat protein